MFNKTVSSDIIIAANQSFVEREYWLKKLSGKMEKTYFLYDHNTAVSSPPKMESLTFRFSGELLVKLITVSNNSNTRLLILLLAALVVQLNKYTGHNDIIVGMPIYRQESEEDFINTTVPVKSELRDDMTVKDLLYQLKQTVEEAIKHQNYPLKSLLYDLDMPVSEEEFPLFDMALLLENIQDRKYILHIPLNMLFSFQLADGHIHGVLEFNPLAYDKISIERIVKHFETLLYNILFNVNTQLASIEILSREEKEKLVYEFNNTEMTYPGEKTLHRLFEDQAERTPDHNAIGYFIDLSDIIESFNDKKINDSILEKYEHCCFKKNPYIYINENRDVANIAGFVDKSNTNDTLFIRTHKGNYNLVNRAVLMLLDYFDGETNLLSLFEAIKKQETLFSIQHLSRNGYAEILITDRLEITIAGQFKEFARLAMMLHNSNLIELVDYNPGFSQQTIDLAGKIHLEVPTGIQAGITPPGQLTAPGEKKIKSPVLLLGDTVGTGSTGLLYLASYLRRNSIEAYCQWNDNHKTHYSLKSNIEKLLFKIQPRVVGISMKWFPHIARVLEMCKIVKEFNDDINVVVGGDTASYFQENIIQCQWIDYLVRGDGEVPLLKICLGHEDIPNCLYKKDGKVIKTPVSYTESESNSPGIYLSHLDEIFIDKKDPYLMDSFFIYTGKGCTHQCFFCAGCYETQKRVFNRNKPLLRDTGAVRKDLIAAQKYSNTFMFDFDLPFYDSLDYYNSIWEGIDLTGHFCEFYSWTLPTPELVKLIAQTFKYSCLSIDLSSLSQEHRLKLGSLKLVKPQPTDAKLFEFFNYCEEYSNIQVKISQIAGLPYFSTEDIKKSKTVLSKLIEKYRCFSGLDWGRLHAQPGAALTENSEKFGMSSYTRTYDDFLNSSELNLKETQYPSLVDFNYPLIYYKDDAFNSEITKFYLETNRQIEQSRQKKQNSLLLHKNITYRELNEKSNGLAGRLRRVGVTPGSITAMLLYPSNYLILGMVGILKAGGAYLPIDPEIPAERKKYILQESKARLVLTDGKVQPSSSYIPAGTRVMNICEKSVYDGGRANPEPVNPPSGLAYVIYTSGSTGKPKGVMVEHRQVVNTLLCRKEEYRLDSGITALQLFSYAFDGFITGFFTPVISGGCVVLSTRESVDDISKMIRVMEIAKVTHFICIPVLYQLILDNITEEAVSRLQVVTLAGDKIPPRLLEKTALKNKHIEIANEYGVTEAAVMSTIYRHQERDVTIKIGRPAWNTAVYITMTGDHCQLMPIGVYGEMCIAGAGVARGYMNNPELTARRFVEDPFVPGRKLLKTSDIGRWLPDGNIEFLGRSDYQVKIRGFRVELGEIERRLLDHGDIEDMVVTARDDGSGDKYICAYIISPGKLKVSQLREYIAAILPNYMIPAYFVFLEKLPLSHNGKVDRKQLPAPEFTLSDETCTPPQDELEKRLAGIWADVLGIEKTSISIDANFFELGGHSLKATILVNTMHKELDVKIPMIEIFKSPNIRSMAKFIREARKDIFASIKPSEEKEYYVLSSAQKRLYVLQQMELESTAYNVNIVVELEGEIERNKLEETFKKLLHRHESLRTSYLIAEDIPVQKIHQKMEFEIQYYEASQAEGKVKVGGIITNFVRPFDLSKTPLLRAGLIKIAVFRQILMVDLHHSIIDFISYSILINDFMLLYNDVRLPALRLQYKDYSEWQQSNPVKEALKRQEKFWSREFWGEIPILNLPTDYSRPPVQRFEGDTVGFEISEDETKAIKKMARLEDATLFMVLLAIFNIFLSKISSQEDIAVGTPIANRRHTDLEKIIGMFANTITLRNRLPWQETFITFFRKLREHILVSFENQDYLFEDLVDNVAVKRDISRNPLFDVMFVFVSDFAPSGEIPEQEMKGLKIKPYNYEHKTAKFDLTLTAMERNSGLFFSIQYCTKLFKKETIDRFIIYFKKIVSIAVKEPGIRISEIEVISEEEKKRILNEFNKTEAVYPKDKTIHRLFEEQVERTPDNIAVVASSIEANHESPLQITYKELNEKSNLVAHGLQKKGVGPDTNPIVGIMVERSIEMISGILGILKSGGAYLPIDPEYPKDRIDYMLKDSRTLLLLTVTPFTESISFSGLILCIDDSTIYKDAASDLQQISQTGDLVYIIYTSGTTGKSKGVLIENNNLVNYVHWFRKKVDLTDRDRTVLTSSFGFDLGYTVVYSSILNGCQLHIIPKESYTSPENLTGYILSHRITYLKMTPSLFSTIIECNEFSGENCQELRLVLFGGEEIKTPDVEKTYEIAPHIEIMNHYGPTEATIGCVAQKIDFDQFEQYKIKSTIGRPINNMRVIILDKGLRCAPVGVPGELSVAGAGVGRGYANRPELTAERFFNSHSSMVISHFSPNDKFSKANNRFYRTGDLTRWLLDGNVEFLGRIDSQVKIRGFRIELGEIESRLLNHGRIKESVVLAREEGKGDKYLCAYIVSDSEPVISELREYLSKELPDYMIPSYFVQFEKIPLTPNGKVDRRALPKPELKVGENYIAPGDEIEKKLAALWSEVLGRDSSHASQLQTSIGIDDDFFELGGHSLKATILVSKIHKVFDVKIPLAELFKVPTIRRLSKFVKRSGEDKYAAIEPAEEKEYYPLSSVQKRMYVVQQMQTESKSYNMPTVVVLDGGIDYKKLNDTFQRLLKRHESLRTSFVIIEGEAAQAIHEDLEFIIDYYETKEENAQKIKDNFMRAFDLSRAPLLRVGLIKIREDRHILMVDMHHIISDGVSHEILVKEFSELYSGENLSPLRIQYKDFTGWQNRLIDSGEMSRQKEFWLSKFKKGDIPALNMPLDYPRPSVRDIDAGDHVSFFLDDKLCKKIYMIMETAGVTLSMVLIAAFNILLYHYTRQEDIVMGIVITGRTHADLEKMIGMFVNTLPLRNHPHKNMTFIEFLEEVKNNSLSAIENQEYPFDELVIDLGLQGETNKNPLFDVAFNLNNIERPEIKHTDLKIEPYDNEKEFAKFDLTLYANEGNETINLTYRYSTQLFKRSTIEELKFFYIEIIEQVIDNVNIKLKDIAFSHDLLISKPKIKHDEISDFIL